MLIKGNPGDKLSGAIVCLFSVGLLAGGLALPGYARNAATQIADASIFENIKLDNSFSPDPTTIRGISGGAVAAGQIAGRAETPTGPCKGYVDQQPDHTIQLEHYFNYLSLQVESTEDTTLVIRGPGGVWCNDDYTGKNPGIAGQWLSGTYQIWVGSYAQNAYHPYVIRVTEKH